MVEDGGGRDGGGGGGNGGFFMGSFGLLEFLCCIFL